MGKKSPPPAPDYVGAAEAQGQENRITNTQQTWANRPNMTTPWGELTWSTTAGVDPATGEPITNWAGNLQLTPQQQAALDSQMRIQTQRSGFAENLMGRAQDAMSQPIDYSQAPAAGQNIDRDWAIGRAGRFSDYGFSFLDTADPGNRDAREEVGPMTHQVQAGDLQNQVSRGPLQNTLSGNRQGTRGSVGYGDIQDELNYSPQQIRERAQSAVQQLQAPELAQRRAAVETQLANQGITRGSEAFTNAMRDVNDAETRAQLMAIAAGRDEAGQLFGQELASGQFQNQAQAQGFGQDLSGARLANDLNQQQWGQQMGEAGLYNQTQGQDFAQQMGAADLYNRAQGQEFSQGMQNANLGNAATATEYQAAVGERQFRNDTRQRLWDNALQQARQGNTEAMQQLQMLMDTENFNNQNRGRYLQEQSQIRSMPLNEMNAFLTGQQVQTPQFFNFNQANRATPTNIYGAMDDQYQSNLDTWGAQNQQRAQTTGAIISAIASYFSDRRLKRDIEYLFTLPNGIKVYKYRFHGSPTLEIGVIAQEVKEIMPQAVHMDRYGYLRVDYNQVLS